ncbi:NADH dehydrogenase [ubiquinone] 1 alpha subcomplex subunit 4-like 2 isoform X1 [Aquila chrysaetos chrysaetos]|uniref:NADH dehydrogenase [ubiquinone] 1 alpha subcomplex subunit 4-like 2 isoform X1 n=1 Tax=Aquila chrysaetos chrysaetos TaxID=223781 RepID=UPI001176C3B6|nr:NADH dehydrogenase [ubiquinone] 1 alpha subcomplex subunit 4-like 2 isoform X1 [Aquila chrysaetos chrysaetos]
MNAVWGAAACGDLRRPNPKLIINPVIGAHCGRGWKGQIAAGAEDLMLSLPLPFQLAVSGGRDPQPVPPRPSQPCRRRLPRISCPPSILGRTALGNLPLQLDLAHTLAMKGPLLGGMFSRHVKRHPGLIPLIGFISVGLGSAVLYLLRLALYSPDISFWQFPPTTRASRKTVPVSELTPGCARAGESMPTPPAAPPQPPPALLAPACPMALRQSPCTQV